MQTDKLPVGVGGATPQEALDKLKNMTSDVMPIGEEEYRQRLSKAQHFMQVHGIDAMYLNAGTNLTYFTGLQWYPSERMVGAVLPARGDVQYIVPHFELGSIHDALVIDASLALWHEHENPYQLLFHVFTKLGIEKNATIAIDESTPFFIVDGLRTVNQTFSLVNAQPVTAHCRMHKSTNELALIQRAMDMTLEVHKAMASILREGITTTEVQNFINQAHKQVGATGSSFCIVLFGEATSFPHGVKTPQTLQYGDVVLIDTGCRLHGYHSDITRTYVFGEPTDYQRGMWQHEKAAQQAAFDAAQYGATCGDVDAAARTYLQSVGLGPEYELPGCPHRTGHGLGLDIHEWPYLVKDNPTVLAQGMCFSNEPMLVIPGQFGIRLEDHFYMGEKGPCWFTAPSHSIDDPFGLHV
ncbi:M24 family metallopeptidase [Aestuariibacter salexigens]|uniref:M24 family metallopeptidase n=1 Tax=Aestuariibacter salexigens TaxID=226010 RepID=UPI000429D685|nr:Xaa-Pro peptidase family protein [Aestuariibacter salexigens]